MKIERYHKAGFAWVEILAVIAMLGLLVAILIPHFVRARTSDDGRGSCIANLKQIKGAMEQYAISANLSSNATCTLADISGGNSKVLKAAINVGVKCPAGGTYAVGATVSDNPTCSLSRQGPLALIGFDFRRR